MTELFNEYKRIQLKFHLPEYNKLQTVFQLNDTFDDINQVRNEMSNKLFDFTEKVIEPLLFCDSYCHAFEKDMMNEEERNELFDIYKQIQSIRWRSHLLILKNDKKESLRIIRDLWVFWEQFEPRMSKLCKKFSDGWYGLQIKDKPVGYHG